MRLSSGTHHDKQQVEKFWMWMEMRDHDDEGQQQQQDDEEGDHEYVREQTLKPWPWH